LPWSFFDDCRIKIGTSLYKNYKRKYLQLNDTVIQCKVIVKIRVKKYE